MGKKIHGKKHRGVKDPLALQMQKEKKLKNLINAPPKNDDQEIPRSLKNILKFKNQKGLQLQKKRKRKSKLIDTSYFFNEEKMQRGMTRPLKQIPRLKQEPGESAEHFLERFNTLAKDILSEHELEEKFSVEVQRDKAGNITSLDHRVLIDPLLTCSEELKRVEESKENKRRKRKELKLRKRVRRAKVGSDDEGLPEYVKDVVEFGEVVHEPPVLSSEKLIKKTGKNKKEFLFLESLKLQSKGKPAVSMARQRAITAERNRALDAYRELKARRRENSAL